MRSFRNMWAAMFLLCLLCLTGCMLKPAALNTRRPITITLWHYYTEEITLALEECIATFNQTVGMENGVIVESIAMGSLGELEQNVTAVAKGTSAQTMPDIFSCYPDKALEIDGYGRLADLSPYFTAEQGTAYVPAFWSEGYFGPERLLLLPFAKSTEVLYVNRTAWQEFCLATGLGDESLAHWETLYAAARQYYHWVDAATPDIPGDGKGMMGIDSIANYIIIGNRQLGVEIMSVDASGAGSVNLCVRALRPVFDLYYRAYSMGYFDAVGRFRSDDVKTADLIAYVGSSSGAAYFPTRVIRGYEKIDIELLSAFYPVFIHGEQYAIQQGAGMCVSRSDAARQEAAVLFLNWFTDVENNTAFALQCSYMPVKKAAYTSEGFIEALAALDGGDLAQSNLGQVYGIALRQTQDRQTYAARPFPGSYDVRGLLEQSMMEMAMQGRAIAASLKAQGKTEAEILEGIDGDAAFVAWLSLLETALQEAGVSFRRTE